MWVEDWVQSSPCATDVLLLLDYLSDFQGYSIQCNVVVLMRSLVLNRSNVRSEWGSCVVQRNVFGLRRSNVLV